MAHGLPKTTLLFSYGLIAMLLLQTIHCRPTIRSTRSKVGVALPIVALQIDHASGKHVIVNEDGSVEATGCEEDTAAHFYVQTVGLSGLITLESVQNQTQYLLVNEAGNLTVAHLPNEESGSTDPIYEPIYQWKVSSPSSQGVIVLTASVNDIDCYIAFDEYGQALPPCSSGLTENSLEVRINLRTNV